MESLARFVTRRRWFVVIGWVLLVVVVGGIAGGAGSAFNDEFTLPDTDSKTAYDILGDGFQGQDGDTEQLVVRAPEGERPDAGVTRERFEALIAKVEQLPHVSSVVSPYTPEGAAQLSQEGRVAFAVVNFDDVIPEITPEDIDRVNRAAAKAEGDGVQFAMGGAGAEQVRQGEQGGSLGTLIGIVVAFVVMYFAFGSILAAVLPLITAILAIGLGSSLVILLSHVLNVATFGPELASLIGLGVGVDYALFIITRHRHNLQRGMSVDDSIALALSTAGRAVVFAGIIVCIALLGMFLLGVSFLYGVAVSASIVVLCTMIAANTLLPALLRLFGMRAVSRRIRRQLAENPEGAKDEEVSAGWLRWGRLVERRKVLFAIGSAVFLLIIAVPFLSLRLGSSDAGNDPKGTTTRQAYDWLAEGFGPGFSGPFQLVARIDGDADRATFEEVVAAVGKERGVAVATPAAYSENGEVAISNVYPTTSPQSEKTTELLDRMRDDVIPDTTDGTDTKVYVGGITAVFQDFASVLAGKLPLFIGIVVALSFVLLALVFRSVLIPLVAAAMNLFAIGASFGIVVAIFQWGWLRGITGWEGGPIEAFVPVMMFAILFGLSMDYEVFLVSRMHEEWVARRDNSEAVTIGQAETGRVITAAGLIMIFVFSAFAIGGERVIALFGIALAAAVVFDAMIIRTMLVPALMHLIGKANWWMPTWLDKALPNLSIEGPSHPAPARDETPGA